MEHARWFFQWKLSTRNLVLLKKCPSRFKQYCANGAGGECERASEVRERERGLSKDRRDLLQPAREIVDDEVWRRLQALYQNAEGVVSSLVVRDDVKPAWRARVSHLPRRSRPHNGCKIAPVTPGVLAEKREDAACPFARRPPALSTTLRTLAIFAVHLVGRSTAHVGLAEV